MPRTGRRVWVCVAVFATGALAMATPGRAGAAPDAPVKAAPTPTTTIPPSTPTVAPAPSAAASGAPASLPFRLGLFYSKAFGQSGGLTQFPGPRPTDLPAPAAIGLDIAIGAGHSIRYHLGIANEWESQGGYSAKGFRLDLVSLGFPIQLANDRVLVHLEPIVHIVRGEILFPSGFGNNNAIFRVESGLAVAITAAMDHWYLGLEPLSLDFRTFAATTRQTQTGFSTLWWFQFTAGRQF